MGEWIVAFMIVILFGIGAHIGLSVDVSPDVVLLEVIPRDGEYHILVEDEGHVWKHILYSEDAVNKYLEEIGGERW